MLTLAWNQLIDQVSCKKQKQILITHLLSVRLPGRWTTFVKTYAKMSASHRASKSCFYNTL
jgi:hypothetical protein